MKPKVLPKALLVIPDLAFLPLSQQQTHTAVYSWDHRAGLLGEPNHMSVIISAQKRCHSTPDCLASQPGHGDQSHTLSFSQFYTLLFQIENAHKQISHQSLLIRFAFLLFLCKSVWSLLPVAYLSIKLLLVHPSQLQWRIFKKAENEQFCSHLHLCKIRPNFMEFNCTDQNKSLNTLFQIILIEYSSCN